jgi:hypothetical protein
MSPLTTSRLSRAVTAAGVLLLLPAVAAAQVPTRPLPKADATFDEPFSSVAGVRELRDGRVLVADNRDKLVQLVNLETGTVTRVGREGAGPGEYGLPTGLVALPGDTTLVVDPMNQRYLPVLPDGKVGATFRIEPKEAGPAGPGGVAIGGLAFTRPRGVDTRGRMYFEGSPFGMGPNGPTSMDSVPLMRLERAGMKVDTLAWLQLPKGSNEIRTSGGADNRQVMIRMGGGTPFAARDEWAVLPDGRIAIARSGRYGVDIVSGPRQRVAGPVVAFTPVKVGEAEKEEYRAARRNAQPIMMTRSVGGGGGGNVDTRAVTSAAVGGEPESWPAVKPPFVGANAVLATPTGEVWVLRSRPASDKIPAYDVFDATGKLTGKVTLPPGTRVVGFGAGTVYTVKLDEDDLQTLQRHRMP